MISRIFICGALMFCLNLNSQEKISMLEELVDNRLHYADSSRLVAPWPVIPEKIKLIIDTDAANEVDDQFAIALALGFPEKLTIEGFVVSHYGLRGGTLGMEKSQKSLSEVLDNAHLQNKFPLLKGIDPLTYLDRNTHSEGVDFIIKTAHTGTKENPVWVVALGPATNVAAAILKDPSIMEKMVVIWHGRSKWPEQCWNFNAYNDIKAVQLLFDLPVRLILFDTGTYLTMPMKESETRIKNKGSLGKYLHDIRLASPYARQDGKGLFDLGDIAVLLDPEICKWEIVDAPSIGHDLRYDFTTKRGKFVRISDINRDECFKLLDAALERIDRN